PTIWACAIEATNDTKKRETEGMVTPFKIKQCSKGGQAFTKPLSTVNMTRFRKATLSPTKARETE
ncbi:MAG: hypothetical protein PF480_00485, partial [Roseovarius sp.]|nr:hypothetical protein [Roseovarius sp.]